MTSAGRLAELRPPPYFVLIDRALRDEGTSYHYLPPAEFSTADPKLLDAVRRRVYPSLRSRRAGCHLDDGRTFSGNP